MSEPNNEHNSSAYDRNAHVDPETMAIRQELAGKNIGYLESTRFVTAAKRVFESDYLVDAAGNQSGYVFSDPDMEGVRELYFNNPMSIVAFVTRNNLDGVLVHAQTVGQLDAIAKAARRIPNGAKLGIIYKVDGFPDGYEAKLAEVQQAGVFCIPKANRNSEEVALEFIQLLKS